jgi:hypothetical protein
MFQDWWENLVDTLKFGGYEPWFPFGIPSKSTHHFPWGHGGEVLNARDVLLGLQEFGYPHIRGVPHASPDVSTGDLALNRFKMGNTQNCKLTQPAVVESDQWNPSSIGGSNGA